MAKELSPAWSERQTTRVRTCQAPTLAPGGLLMLLSPSKFNEHERTTDPTHINLYAPTELRDLLQTTGFARVIPFDDVLPRLGTSFLGRRIVKRVFRMTSWDWLSASANVRAYKAG